MVHNDDTIARKARIEKRVFFFKRYVISFITFKQQNRKSENVIYTNKNNQNNKN